MTGEWFIEKTYPLNITFWQKFLWRFIVAITRSMCLDKKTNDLDAEIYVMKTVREYLLNIAHMLNSLPTKLKSNIAKFILNIIKISEKNLT